MSVDSKMKAIADQIRTLIGSTGTMGLDAMATNLTAANSAVASAKTAIANKGVSVPSGAGVTDLAALIESISAGATMVTGTFTLTGDATSYTITHNKGKILPNVAVGCRTTANKYGSEYYAINQAVIAEGIEPFGVYRYYANSGLSMGCMVSATFTNSQVKLTGRVTNDRTSYFIKGIEYTYVAWG